MGCSGRSFHGTPFFGFVDWKESADYLQPPPSKPMKSPLPFLLLLGALTVTALAQKPARPDVLAPIEDQPGLPRVLLIGDSISIGYTQPVRDLLKEKAIGT